MILILRYAIRKAQYSLMVPFSSLPPQYPPVKIIEVLHVRQGNYSFEAYAN